MDSGRGELKHRPLKTLNKEIVKKVLDTLKGHHVIARDDSDGHYYPGVVLKCPDARHALVEFANKEQKLVPTRMVIASSGAIPRPNLRAGDYVLVRVLLDMSNPSSDCYVPGIVQVPPARNEAQAKFYTVLMYNGQQATTLRKHLMKISKSRFEFAIRYIAEVQNQDRNRIEDKVYVTPRREKEDRSRKPYRSKGRENRKVKSASSSRSRSPTPVKKELLAPQRPTNPTPDSHRHYEKQDMITPQLSLASSPVLSLKNRSRSTSKSPPRQRSRSPSSSRSRSRSRSRTPDNTYQNTSRSSSITPVKNRSRSPTPNKDRSRSKSRSRSGSRSTSSSSSSESSIQQSGSQRSRSKSSDSVRRKESKERLQKKAQKLKALKKQLQDQQKAHEQQQEEIQKQSKMLKKLKKKLKKKKKNGTVLGPYSTKSQVVEVERSENFDYDDEKKSTNTGTLKVKSGLLEQRKSLPVLREGEEVLARWSDEGWYFRGIVQQDCGDLSYIIEDSTRMCEKIWREDIITDYDDANQIIQPKDAVVALHPHYNFSYAPGIVLEVYQDLHMKIRFYDGEESTLPREEIYKLTTEKFEHDVNYIIECETRWVGQAVVGRNDENGTYHFASVKERVGNGREYMLEWCDGSVTRQKSINIFGTFTKHHPLAIGDHVLAMVDEHQHVYLPGWVAGIIGDKINIKFCNGVIQNIDDVLQCFWLSSRYYDYAKEYYLQRNLDGSISPQ
ncbi:uncharacterized protein LOC110442323 isoform X2 [Mizuhopecten yessoensis]|nr:uncharacterized protein LOC110442323 isoform X2 [Mizuhopecten yessoensis]